MILLITKVNINDKQIPQYMRALLFNSKGLGGVERSALKKLTIKLPTDSTENTAINVTIC